MAARMKTIFTSPASENPGAPESCDSVPARQTSLESGGWREGQRGGGRGGRGGGGGGGRGGGGGAGRGGGGGEGDQTLSQQYPKRGIIT